MSGVRSRRRGSTCSAISGSRGERVCVAAGKTVAYLTERISPCQMTEEHDHELGPGTEALCVSVGSMFRYQAFKVPTRNFRENLTEQARYL